MQLFRSTLLILFATSINGLPGRSSPSSSGNKLLLPASASGMEGTRSRAFRNAQYPGEVAPKVTKDLQWNGEGDGDGNNDDDDNNDDRHYGRLRRSEDSSDEPEEAAPGDEIENGDDGINYDEVEEEFQVFYALLNSDNDEDNEVLHEVLQDAGYPDTGDLKHDLYEGIIMNQKQRKSQSQSQSQDSDDKSIQRRQDEESVKEIVEAVEKGTVWVSCIAAALGVFSWTSVTIGRGVLFHSLMKEVGGFRATWKAVMKNPRLVLSRKGRGAHRKSRVRSGKHAVDGKHTKGQEEEPGWQFNEAAKVGGWLSTGLMGVQMIRLWCLRHEL